VRGTPGSGDPDNYACAAGPKDGSVAVGVILSYPAQGDKGAPRRPPRP
jgi:hypothetical protein